MKNRLFSLCVFALLAINVLGRNATNGHPAPAQHASSYKTEAGDCSIPVSTKDLDINNVRARLLDAGDMWWDFTSAKYEVPKGDQGSGQQYAQAIFAGAIWISALDAAGNLKIAAQLYRQGNSDFYTGPLDATGTIGNATCNLWDRHFNVLGADIAAFQANPNALNDDIKSWPAKGNAYLAAQGLDMSQPMAPFFDNNGDGIYNPLDGDYPTTKPCTNTYADQMVFWVMNDKGNVHSATSGQQMGIQLNTLAFAFKSNDEINNMTFYSYNIINKSSGVFNKTYMSQFVDPDLGCSENDRIGCDTLRSLGYVYNGALGQLTTDDGAACQSGQVGYGANLPMLGVDFFEGPIDTNGQQLGMSSFVYFTRGNATPTSDPTSAAQFRNYQTGFWRDGTPITLFGNGYGGTNPTRYVYPGDPSIATQWSECNPQVGSAIPAADRRFLQTSGPFTFNVGSTQTITIGVIFVQPPGGVGSNCPNLSAIGAADDKAQALFKLCFKKIGGPDAPTAKIRELDQKIVVNLINIAPSNNVNESYAQVAKPAFIPKGYVEGSGADSLYRFQGYIVYQLKDITVSANDLSDPTKAVPIATMDIADNIKHLTNWTQTVSAYDGNQKSWAPSLDINLPNTGIQHTLEFTKDYIGGGNLINNKTYYYGVIAFATNQFKKFDAKLPDHNGQDEEFKLGNNFNKYSAIPGSPEVENGGRKLQSDWGGATTVTRWEGQGNGSNFLNLTPAAVQKILAQGYEDTLEYASGYDPIGFKITDPILLKEADFELKIYDTVPYNDVSVSTKAWWELTDLTNHVVIKSERTLDRPYQQMIASTSTSNKGKAERDEYGFALTLGTPFPINFNKASKRPIYGPIGNGGTITFKDPSRPWLSFVKDAGQNDASNWIRSGPNTDPCVGASPDILCNVFVDAYYKAPGSPLFYMTDSNKDFAKIADGTWAPYCLAANWSQAADELAVPNKPTTVSGPAFKWDKTSSFASSPRNTLDRLQSVDIVITPDKSKWSQCVVFETSESNSTEGGELDPSSHGKSPHKGMLRGHLGMNLDGTLIDGSDPNLSKEGYVGRSYFPGYAINVETGRRLNISFGEASDKADQNGRDMVFNPTSQVYSTLNLGGTIPKEPLFGGKHYIYVFETTYDGGNDVANTLLDPANYGAMVTNPSTQPVPAAVASVYDQIMWTAIPYLTQGYKYSTWKDGLVPGEVTIQLRVQKPYAKYGTAATDPATGDSMPRYRFSTKGLGVKEGQDSMAKAALEFIRIVPNPYYAYSAYEQNAIDTRIKVINLPNRCTVKIYTLDGTLVRTIERSISIDPLTQKKVEISDGFDPEDKNNSFGANLDNTVEWDLKNEKNIPIASGIYLFDINVPGVGHKILKWFGAMRPTDVSNF